MNELKIKLLTPTAKVPVRESSDVARARGLVGLLGWDWYDGVRSLAFETTTTLDEYKRILSTGEEDALSGLGIKHADFWLGIRRDGDRLVTYAASMSGLCGVVPGVYELCDSPAETLGYIDWM